MSSPRLPLLAVAAGLLILAGCKDKNVVAYRAPKDPAPAATPASAQSGMPDNHPPVAGQNLPDNHPPVGGQAPAAGGDMATMANTAVPTAGGTDLKWTAPETWKPKAGSSMRKGSYAVSRNGAEADFAITAFPGDTGGLHANINRWRGQVGLAPAAPADIEASVQHIDGQGLHFDVVDLAGPSGTRMLGAIVAYNGNSWFFKLMGPDAVVAAEKPTFLAFLQTVKAP